MICFSKKATKLTIYLSWYETLCLVLIGWLTTTVIEPFPKLGSLSFPLLNSSNVIENQLIIVWCNALK